MQVVIDVTFTRTLITNNPKTAPDAPTDTADFGRSNHETRLAPAPARMYEIHNAKFPCSSSTNFPVQEKGYIS